MFLPFPIILHFLIKFRLLLHISHYFWPMFVDVRSNILQFSTMFVDFRSNLLQFSVSSNFKFNHLQFHILHKFPLFFNYSNIFHNSVPASQLILHIPIFPINFQHFQFPTSSNFKFHHLQFNILQILHHFPIKFHHFP